MGSHPGPISRGRKTPFNLASLPLSKWKVKQASGVMGLFLNVRGDPGSWKRGGRSKNHFLKMNGISKCSSGKKGEKDPK